MATRLFLAFLGLVAALYLAVLVYHLSAPRDPNGDWKSVGYIDRCRQICLKYGLLPTGDVAADAKAYLDAAKADPANVSGAKSQGDESHPLLGRTAPQFTLSDEQGKPCSLEDLNRNGPIIVVFYYGYYCSHCVAQLFGLDADLTKFRQRGVQIVALSPDPPETTAERFRQYGRFHFPVLSDTDNKVAEQYAVFQRATDVAPEDQRHGTFVVDGSGKIIWAYTGETPFVDNEALLRIVSPTTAKRD